MNRINYILATLLAILFSSEYAEAQHITVSAPSRVAAGENFRIAYSINTQDVEEFRCGNVPAPLEVVAGPYTSSQRSIQMINGHTSSSSSTTITYTVYAAKDGTYTISPAHAVVEGKRLQSKPIKIVVAGHVQASNRMPRMHQDQGYNDDAAQVRAAGSRISGKDLFIRVTANKKTVHEQEPVLLTYKVFTRVGLSQLEGKMPDLKGFHTQEVKLPQQKVFHDEMVNGVKYKTVTWSQYVMYPQMTGHLQIPSITFKGIVVEENRNVDPLEAFFNGGSGYVEVHREIEAPGVNVNVLPLPQRPKDFSGGVGRFNITAQLNHDHVKAGDPINIRVVIGGIGNLKLLKQPVINFPKDFDKYDAKITDKTRLTANGVEGNMVFDYLAVPRNQGTFTIPAIEFTYYDTNANAYKTIKTQAFTVTVDKGDGSASATVDDFSANNNDIHPLKKGDAEVMKSGDFFFGSGAYWVSLLLPLVLFVALLIVFRQRAIDNADVVRMRSNKANKIARKRLKKASMLMFRNRKEEFFDEVLRALWGYVSFKLNIPRENLTRDNIREKLTAQNVDDATVDKFVGALDECEFERYAPGDASGNMNRTFEAAMTAIMDIENVMKNNKKKVNTADSSEASHGSGTSGAGHSGATLLLLLALLLAPLHSLAVTKANADAEYAKGNYQQAIKDYQELLRGGVSAEIYYNLGNAYYRTDNITQAVLAYERAHMLSPGDEDIRFNLEFARSKTIDKITPESEMFFVTWWKSLVNFTSVDNWARLGIFCIIMALFLVLAYLFCEGTILRKIGFFGALIFVVLFAMSNICAWQQKSALDNRTGAIVTAPSIQVKKTPAQNSGDVVVVHEGTRVDITDKSMQQWRGIHLADGRDGWIPTTAIEEI